MPANILLSKTFSEASAKLPKDIQSKVTTTINEAFTDVTSIGLHSEKLFKGEKEGYYSLRVNDSYRIIYYRPKANGITMLLYVAKHDDAYKWADTHRCEISNGNIQIFDEPPAKAKVNASGELKPVARLSVLTDEDMVELGIERGYWEQLRTQIFVPRQLLGYKKLLAEETYYTLEQLLNGFDKEQALKFYRDLTAPVVPVAIPKVALFEEYNDEDLMKLGVPGNLLDLVRAVNCKEEFIGMQDKLPELARQYLTALMDGESLRSVLDKAKKGNTATADDDFEKAAQNPGTKLEFVQIESIEMLKRIMDMPMEKWRVFLHPEQRNMVERHFNGPARVLGGAGTGKTVIVIHRACFLARTCLLTGEKVLVTTYTKTLAEDIKQRLAMLCNAEELAHIDVINIDKLAYDLAYKAGYRIKYDSNKSHPLGELWLSAIYKYGTELHFEEQFYKDEWKDVIQAQNITDLQGYIECQRTGRGKQRIDQKQRESVWRVMQEYTRLANIKKIADADWAENRLVEFLAQRSDLRAYKSILVDECQDLSSPALRMLRSLAGPQHQDDLYFAGDSRQRIYAGNGSFAQCGIAVSGRSSQLKMNYRTTLEIYEAALKLQKGYQYDDMDQQSIGNDKCICVRHGDKPELRSFPTYDREFGAMLADIRAKQAAGVDLRDICIVTRRTVSVHSCKNSLQEHNFPFLILDRDQPDDKSIDGVRLATMHRTKGMEFKCMYIMGLGKDVIPPVENITRANGDEELLADLMKQEANLIAVAMTRAIRTVWISYTGEPSVLLDTLKEYRVD